MYKTLLAGIASLVISSSPLVQNEVYGEDKKELHIAPVIKRVPHNESNVITNLYLIDRNSKDTILNLYYNEINGAFFLVKNDKRCEENKDLIKKSLDTSAAIINSSDARRGLSGLKKYLRYISNGIGKGKSIEESVVYAKQNVNNPEEENEFKGTILGYLQEETRKRPIEPNPKKLDPLWTKIDPIIDSMKYSEIDSILNGKNETKAAMPKNDSTEYTSGSVLSKFLTQKKDTTESKPQVTSGSVLDKFLRK